MLTSKSKGKTDIWLCLRFPYLALNCAGVRFTSEHTAAAIVKQQTIIQANLLAQQSGIKTGQAAEHAHMLNPNLELIECRIELETEKLQTLCAWAYRYTSHMSVYNDHTLLLEIGRSLTFFKGIESMQNLVLADLERLEIDIKYGVANTPKAAHLLSFSPQKQWQVTDYKTPIEQSLIKHLSVPEKTLEQLHSCGFDLVKSISTIPKAQLGARFGKPFILYLEQLDGNTADPQTLHCTPETFKACIDFAEPITNRAWIEPQIDRLLNDLVVFVNSRQLTCRSLTWRFYNEQSHLVNSVTVGLNMNNIKLQSLKELTDLKLSALSLKWAFSSIELSSEELIPKKLLHQDLFDPIADQEEFNRLIDKVTSRLGNNSVYRLNVADEHLPELANIRYYFASQTAPVSQSRKTAAAINTPTTYTHFEQYDEPVWLLRQPQMLNKKHDQPKHNGDLKLIHGPNRISSHWWQALQNRDYYIAKQNNGRLLWIYYERSQQNWYLHGLYA